MNDGNMGRMRRSHNRIVCSSPACLLYEGRRGTSLRIDLHFCAHARRSQYSIVRNGLVQDRADELFTILDFLGPPFGDTSTCVDPIEARLVIMIFTLDRTVVHPEKNVTAISRPLNVLLHCFIVGELTRNRRIAA